mgnify:CR=1 FL=1
MNYLEHKTQVKFVDGLLAQSQEWQWLIDEIQERFEIKEITSWEQYIAESVSIRNVFGYFVKILNVCDKDWIYSKEEFKEIWEIAKFYIGSVNVNDCVDKILHNQCKLFFFCVWITKLENGDNNSDYLYDIRLLNQKNYFELIKCDSLLEAEKKLEISVTDTGIGIPKEKQEKVFERFYKMNSFSQGTGLGLSISRTIAEKLGGSLHIDSSYTDGCRMVLTLPLVYAE